MQLPTAGRWTSLKAKSMLAAAGRWPAWVALAKNVRHPASVAAEAVGREETVGVSLLHCGRR